MRVSQYRKFGKEYLLEIISKSSSLREVILAYGLSPNGQGGYSSLHKICEEWDINLDEIKWQAYKQRAIGGNKRLTQEEALKKFFFKGSGSTTTNLKKYCFRFNLIPYECARCGNPGEWNDNKLTLQLEHKNGVHSDNTLNNLEFLCPNCHSQTITFAGKNKKPGCRPKRRPSGQPKKIEKIEEIEEIEKKLKKTEQEKNRLLFLETVDCSKYGWVQKVADAWGVKPPVAKRWIQRHCPEFTGYQRTKKS